MIDPMLFGGLTAALGALLVASTGRRRPTSTPQPSISVWETTTTTTTTRRLEVAAGALPAGQHIELPQWAGRPMLENR